MKEASQITLYNVLKKAPIYNEDNIDTLLIATDGSKEVSHHIADIDMEKLKEIDKAESLYKAIDKAVREDLDIDKTIVIIYAPKTKKMDFISYKDFTHGRL